MYDSIFFVQDPATVRCNRGAYDQPFSGVGIEYEPLGVGPDRTGLTLHETGYVPANADWNFPAVFSPFWRLYYNSSRGHCVLFGEQAIELTPDHLVLIPPHCFFHCLGRNPVPNLWMHFSFTRKLHPELVPPVLLAPGNTERCLIHDLQELILADANWKPIDVICRHSLALLHVVLSRPELRWQVPLSANLQRVQQYIETSLHTPLRIADLAKRAGLSVTGLNRAFHTHFGTSPARYVTEMRVREAARLLRHSKDSIEAIAEQTGFCNRAHFSRVFKRVTHGAPAGFRRQYSRTL